jgi:catalase
MNVNKNQEKGLTYYFNSLNVGPRADSSFKPSSILTDGGFAGRFEFKHPPTEFGQVRILYNEVLSEDERKNLISNIAESLRHCRHDIQQNMVRLFTMVDEDYGARVLKALQTPPAAKHEEHTLLGKIGEKIGKAMGLSSGQEEFSTLGTNVA